MKSLILPFVSLSAVSATAFPNAGKNFHRFAPRQLSVAWAPCHDNVNIECGRFEVPMDWTDATAGKASLAVIRYKATTSPRLGSIFTNPGGPGVSGVDSIVGGNGESISTITGGQYDIVSWDPRGVKNSLPRVDCFETAAEETAFWQGSIPDTGLEARGNFTEQVDLDYFYSQVDDVDLKLGQLWEQCIRLSGDTLKYVGTVAAVRDMVAMAEYLEPKSKLINYWGFSYGTLIGAYFVNMYPDRVGRVAIDGVVNPVYWAQHPAHFVWGDSLTSADETLEGFALACAQSGPTGCAIATQTSTKDSVLAWIRALLDKSYDYYRAGYTEGGYKSSVLRNRIHNAMYQPSGWVELADLMAKVDLEITQTLAGGKSSTTAIHKFMKRYEEDRITRGVIKMRADGTAPDYSLQAITCADAIDAGDVTTKDVFDELVRVTREISPFFGPSWSDAGLCCHKSKTRAVERYQGPWNKTLANPILVIGNEADPITPYASAKFVADLLGDSAVLVEQDDYGHCSLALHSDCTVNIVGTYFTTGVLPTQDQFCAVEAVLFPGPGITRSSLKSISQDNVSDDKASTTASTSSDSTSNAANVKVWKEKTRTLYFVIGALILVICILFLFNMFQCMRSIRQKNARTYTRVDAPQTRPYAAGAPAAYSGWVGHDSDSHHKYSDPYDGPRK